MVLRWFKHMFFPPKTQSVKATPAVALPYGLEASDLARVTPETMTLQHFLALHLATERPEQLEETDVTRFVLANFPNRVWINGPMKCGNTKLRMFLVHYVDAMHGKQMGPMHLDQVEFIDSSVYHPTAPNLTNRNARVSEHIFDTIPALGYPYAEFLPRLGYFFIRNHGLSCVDSQNPVEVQKIYTPILQSCKALFPIRHPFDMAVSYYHHIQSREEYRMSPAELFTPGNKYWDTFRGQLLKLVQMQSFNGKMVYYEDWNETPQETAQEILDYLGWPVNPEWLQYALFESDVKRAREKEDTFRPEDFQYRRARDGSSNQWQTFFDAETIARLTALVVDDLKLDLPRYGLSSGSMSMPSSPL